MNSSYLAVKHYFIVGIIVIFLPFSHASANPSGGVVTHGTASFNQQGSTLNITNSPGTIIDWQKFSIESNETTRFIQQSVDSSVLNRVVSQDPSKILGSLQSNGRVFIINPNGILFGQNSIIDVNGLVASSLNMSNADFLNKQLNFTGDGTNGLVNNQGAITTAEGGFVYLIAPDIENHGVITSPKGDVILAAGHSVQLVTSDDPDIRVTLTAPEGEALNVGDIITRGGKTSIYAGLINQQGTVNADSAVVGENGKIFFKATQRTTLSSTSVTTANGVEGGSVTIKTTEGLTEVSGTISASGSYGNGGNVQVLGEHVGIIDNANIDASGLKSGGTVLIGGDNKGATPDIQNAKATYIGVDTRIHADAKEEGDGGTVIVWSDDATRAYGTVTAKGGSTYGNGGYVETSGGYLDIAGLKLDVSAVNGKGGAWLLDPYDITISGTTTINSTAGPIYTPTATASNIFAGDIVTQLNAGTAVTVDTTGAGAESGNITVNASIIKTTGPATTLTLKAHNNIITNFNIGSGSGALDISLIADQDSNGAGSVTLNGLLNSLNGNIDVSAAGDITFNSGTNTIDAGTGSATLTSGAWIHGDPAGAPTDITAGSVTLNGTNGIFANSGSAQFTVSTPTLSFSNSGNGLVRIHNSYVGATSVTGSNNSGDIIIQNTDNANALTVGNITASNGLISLNSDIIDITGSVNAGANVVYLKNFVNNAAISVEGGALFDINSAELANITAGNIQIGKDTFGNYAGAATIASSANVDVGGKNLWVTAKNGVTISAFNVNNTGGEFYIDNITSGDITTGSGLITSDIIQFRSIGNINIGSGGISSTTAGDVILKAADINITGPVNVGTNSIFLEPYVSNTPISFGGASGFNLTNADVTNINAGSTIYVGSNFASTADIGTSEIINQLSKTIFIRSNDTMTIGGNGLFINSSGHVNLQTYSATANIDVNGVISSGNITLNSGNQITVGTGSISSVLSVAMTANSDILLTGNVSTNSANTINVTSTTGNINMAGTSILSTDGGDITYAANGNITLGRLYTGLTAGNVSLTSTTGSITDVGVANENIYASSATLNASAGIGNVGFDVYFNNLGTTNLTANTTSGGVTINSNTAMNLGNVYGGTGSVALTTTGASSYMSSGASIISGAGVSMNSSQNLTIGPGGAHSEGNLSLTAAGVLSQSGTISTGSGGSIQLISNSANLNAITSANNIGIETDQISLAGFVNANSGTGNLYIMPRNLNPISIDGSEVFDLTQGELTNISFGTFILGSDGTTTRATTASISSVASTTVGGGPGIATVRSLNDITFGANNFSAVGADMTFTSDTGNIITGAGNLISGNVTYNAAGNIIDGNGVGVLDVTATNLTVNSGGNASLDYEITGTLNSTGVVGIKDLRPFTTASTTITSSSETLDTAIATVTETTNTLAPTPLEISSTETAPLSEPTTDTATTSESTTETTSESTTEVTQESTSDDESNDETQVATAEEDKKETKQLAAKNLPICR